jgi:hypothetical protein
MGLGVYDHMYYDAPDVIDDDQDDDTPCWPTEALTSANGVVWWSAAQDDNDDV